MPSEQVRAYLEAFRACTAARLNFAAEWRKTDINQPIIIHDADPFRDAIEKWGKANVALCDAWDAVPVGEREGLTPPHHEGRTERDIRRDAVFARSVDAIIAEAGGVTEPPGRAAPSAPEREPEGDGGGADRQTSRAAIRRGRTSTREESNQSIQFLPGLDPRSPTPSDF